MIEYSKQESEIFGIEFGRSALISDFTDWQSFAREIKSSEYKFIRIKIRNPVSEQIQHLHNICKQLHLLEILRVYSFSPDYSKEYHFNFDDYIYKNVTENNFKDLLHIIENTYEDIPFGNYTSPYIIEFFPVEKQRKNFIDFYKNELLKTNSNKTAHIIYNLQNIPIGCIVTEVFKDFSYTYYVGVLKEFRNKYVLTKTINFIQSQVIQNKFTSGLGAARLSNIHSQKAFESNNMILDGYDFIYLLEV